MADQRLVGGLGVDIDELARRVSILERNSLIARGQNSLTGSMTILAQDGTVLARVGRVSDDPNGGGARQGLEIGSNPTGNQGSTWLRATSVGGVELPHVPLSWNPLDEYRSTTSGSFSSLWSGAVNALSSKFLSGYVVVACDSGTTGEVRVGSGTGYTTAKTFGMGSFTFFLTWSLPAGYVLGSGPVTFYVQARRASGSGSVHLYAPSISLGRDTNTNSSGWTP